jgi:hypothetical protein
MPNVEKGAESPRERPLSGEQRGGEARLGAARAPIRARGTLVPTLFGPLRGPAWPRSSSLGALSLPSRPAGGLRGAATAAAAAAAPRLLPPAEATNGAGAKGDAGGAAADTAALLPAAVPSAAAAGGSSTAAAAPDAATRDAAAPAPAPVPAAAAAADDGGVASDGDLLDSESSWLEEYEAEWERKMRPKAASAGGGASAPGSVMGDVGGDGDDDGGGDGDDAASADQDAGGGGGGARGAAGAEMEKAKLKRIFKLLPMLASECAKVTGSPLLDDPFQVGRAAAFLVCDLHALAAGTPRSAALPRSMQAGALPRMRHTACMQDRPVRTHVCTHACI